MGDTFNAFVKFISDDPIMLGLCIAIIVLIIAFILVLFLGRKKTDKGDNNDNTTELLKTEVNMDALKSTQEFSVSEIQDATNTPVTPEETPVAATTTETETFTAPDINIEAAAPVQPASAPVVEAPVAPVIEATAPTPEPQAMEIPVETNVQPVSLEVPETPTVASEQAPTLNPEAPTFDSIKITEPTPKVETPTYQEENIFDMGFPSESKPIVEPTVEATPEPVIEQVPLDESTITPIVESSVNPVEPEPINNELENFFNSTPFAEDIKPATPVEPPKKEVELPSMTEPAPVEAPKYDAPFSSVNVDANAELPNINMNDFSKTEIIRHIPVLEGTSPIIEPTVTNDTEEDLDDIDLPMFNTNSDANKNGINALKGETFNI